MSVTVDSDRIRLSANAAVEDAEPLLRALIEQPALCIDVEGLVSAHFAVVQLLKAAGRPIVGQPSNPFLRDFVLAEGNASPPR